MSSLPVPFFRPEIGEQEIAEVVATLRSGWLTSGKRVKLFEDQFAASVGAPHAVALNSCTAALHLAVEALGLKPGQGVLVPTMTFAATAEVVRYLGAVPILVDCDPVSLNMSLEDAERKLSADYADYAERAGGEERRSKGGGRDCELRIADCGMKIVGIMPVHVGGMMMDVGAVKEFAAKHGLWIVEDAAHAFPAGWKAVGSGQWAVGRDQESEIRDRRTEIGIHRRDAEDAEVALRTEGRGQEAEGRDQKSEIANQWERCGEMEEGERRIVCFSFYANKTITTGEGGMAVTGDAELAQRMRLMSLHGLSQDAWERYSGGTSWDYRIIAPGFKYNLTDIAAAIGIHQLARAEDMRIERERVAQFYLNAFENVAEIELPPEDANRIHAWHLFPIKLRLERLGITRNQFVDKLRDAGVGCSVHWRPLHLHPYYQNTYGLREEDCPVASALWQRLISLPIFPGMRGEEMEQVVETVKGICRGEGKGVRSAECGVRN